MYGVHTEYWWVFELAGLPRRQLDVRKQNPVDPIHVEGPEYAGLITGEKIFPCCYLVMGGDDAFYS
jgi:hypothetical protein